MRILTTRTHGWVSLLVSFAIVTSACGDGQVVEVGQQPDRTIPPGQVDSVPGGQSQADLDERLGVDEGQDGMFGSLGDPDALAGLKLELVPIEEEVQLGGLVGVQAILSNPTDELVEVAALLDPVVPASTYTIAGPGREDEIFVPARLDEGFATPQPLPAGASVAYVVPLYWGAEGITFQESGEFHVAASFATVEPAEAAFFVLESDGDALEIFFEENILRFLFDGGGEHYPEALDLLTDVSESENELSRYATYALIRYWLQPGRDFAEGTIRQVDIETALELVDRAREQELAAPWLAHAIITGLDSAVANGNDDVAGILFELLEADFEDVPAATTAVDRYRDNFR